MDLHSRRIVGWQMAPLLRTELVADALEMAIARRRPDRVSCITPTRARRLGSRGRSNTGLLIQE